MEMFKIEIGQIWVRKEGMGSRAPVRVIGIDSGDIWLRQADSNLEYTEKDRALERYYRFVQPFFEVGKTYTFVTECNLYRVYALHEEEGYGRVALANAGAKGSETWVTLTDRQYECMREYDGPQGE